MGDSSDSDSDSESSETEEPISPSDSFDLDDASGDVSAEEAVANAEAMLENAQQRMEAEAQDDGELMVSLSPATIANLWAVTGLLLLINITFCLYKVCRSDSKQRYFSESDHYESQVPDIENHIHEFHD